jgi:hypothetical protein
LKAEITATGPLGRDRLAEELARLADGEVADVDHLLHLAPPLGPDLPDLERHEGAEVLLGLAQLLAEQAHELAAPRRRDIPPRRERVRRVRDGEVDGDRARRHDPADAGAVDRREDVEVTAPLHIVHERVDAEATEHLDDVVTRRRRGQLVRHAVTTGPAR